MHGGLWTLACADRGASRTSTPLRRTPVCARGVSTLKCLPSLNPPALSETPSETRGTDDARALVAKPRDVPGDPLSGEMQYDTRR